MATLWCAGLPAIKWNASPWFPPCRHHLGMMPSGEVRADEIVAYYSPRPFGHFRVRKGRRARRMGGPRLLRVLESGSVEFRRQAALGLPRRMAWHRIFGVVDAGADRQCGQSGP